MAYFPEPLIQTSHQTPLPSQEIPPTFSITVPINKDGVIENRIFNVTVQSEFGEDLSDLILKVKNSIALELIQTFWHEGNGITTTQLQLSGIHEDRIEDAVLTRTCKNEATGLLGKQKGSVRQMPVLASIVDKLFEENGTPFLSDGQHVPMSKPSSEFQSPSLQPQRMVKEDQTPQTVARQPQIQGSIATTARVEITKAEVQPSHPDTLSHQSSRPLDAIPVTATTQQTPIQSFEHLPEVHRSAMSQPQQEPVHEAPVSVSIPRIDRPGTRELNQGIDSWERKNFPEAYNHLLKSAKEGNSVAMFFLAKMHESSDKFEYIEGAIHQTHIEPDFKLSEQWLLRSACLGNKTALKLLSKMYEKNAIKPMSFKKFKEKFNSKPKNNALAKAFLDLSVSSEIGVIETVYKGEKLSPKDLIKASTYISEQLEKAKKELEDLNIPTESLDEAIPELAIPTAVAGPIQIPASTTVHHYTGDLTVDEKALLKSKSIADTVVFNFTSHPTFNVTVRRQDIFESGAQVIVNVAN